MDDNDTNDARDGDPNRDAEERDWSEMTLVCLVNVFQRLSLRDRWAGAMCVCRAWRDAAGDSALNHSLDLEPYFQSAGPDSATWWTPAFERRVDAMLRSTAEWADGSLKEVRVRHCSDGALRFVAERSPNLEILSINSSRHVTDASMARIAICCLNLTELDISYCYEITYKSIKLIGQNCPNLSVLKRNMLNWLDPSQHAGIIPQDYLNALPQDGEQEAITIAMFLPKLKHLELRFSRTSNNPLLLISEKCKDLEVLDLFGCSNLTSRGIEQVTGNLSNLKILTRPNFYIPRSVFHAERYGHWRLYDERFQTNVFQI